MQDFQCIFIPFSPLWEVSRFGQWSLAFQSLRWKSSLKNPKLDMKVKLNKFKNFSLSRKSSYAKCSPMNASLSTQPVDFAWQYLARKPRAQKQCHLHEFVFQHHDNVSEQEVILLASSQSNIEMTLVQLLWIPHTPMLMQPHQDNQWCQRHALLPCWDRWDWRGTSKCWRVQDRLSLNLNRQKEYMH